MSQLIDLAPSLSPRRQAQGARSAAVAAAVAGGLLAAGLGLGFLAVLVLLLWITSPYPDSGPGGALHLVADLWLLAHGADLVRTETRTGVPAPVGLTPLLLTVLPVFLLHRAARDALTPQDCRPALGPLATGAWVACGYLAVAGAVTAYAVSGPLHASPAGAALVLPLTVAAATAAGVWSAAGPAAALLPGCPVRPVHPARPADVLVPAPSRTETAVRAAGAGLAALLGGGALLCAAALVTHAAVAQDHFLALSSGVSGRLGVLLLCVALLPNAAVWAAAYALGPGFAVGTGSTVTPLGAADHALQPVFPLLAAVPGEGAGGPLTWAAAAVPVAAGAAVGWYAGRAAVPVPGRREPGRRWETTAGTAALAALGCGAGMAVLAWLAGGPLGTRTLADFGPVWWQAGGAAAAWTAAVGVPAALAVRGFRLRGADGPPPGERTWSGRARSLWEACARLRDARPLPSPLRRR